MLEILFYQPEQDRVITSNELVVMCEKIDGVILEKTRAEVSQEGYCPGLWRDTWTHAHCILDIGEVDYDHADARDEKTYTGWRKVALAVKIPFSCPHWHCVEALRFVETLLGKMPNVKMIDTEDSDNEDGIEGPRALDRMRCLSSWELLHHAQTETRGDMYRMSRIGSIAVWRYRRELAQLAESEQWPQVFVLLDGTHARSAMMWQDPENDIIFPPVELIIIQRGTGKDAETGVVPSDELVTCATHITNLDKGGAVLITADEKTQTFFRETKLLPPERFSSLSDEEWSD